MSAVALFVASLPFLLPIRHRSAAVQLTTTVSLPESRAPRKVFSIDVQRGYPDAEIRFPVICQWILSCWRRKTAFEFLVFFQIATSFKTVLDSQGGHS